MQQGWESEAANWARFTRTPGHDHALLDINLPVLMGLLPPPGRRTLDVGCGEGRVSRLLHSRGHRVVGIDAAPTMVRLAASHEAGQPALVADAGRLPFRDGAFDLAVAYMALHDIDDMPRAVAEIGRVLERGGRLCLAIVHPINSAGAFQGSGADAPFVISGSYLDPARLSYTVERDGIQLTFHSQHRPMEACSRALEAAGLLVEAIREPGAGDHLVARQPAQRRWARVPLFLHARAVKLAQRAQLWSCHPAQAG